MKDLEECYLDKISDKFFKVGIFNICGWVLDNSYNGKKQLKIWKFLNIDFFSQAKILKIFYGKW
jgi:hypothetical protein